MQAAARRYYGKNASELTLSECAVLAAIPQNPSRYNPVTNPDANKKRQQTVLNYMQEQGYISQSEKESACLDDVYARIHAFNEAYDEESVYTY